MNAYKVGLDIGSTTAKDGSIGKRWNYSLVFRI